MQVRKTQYKVLLKTQKRQEMNDNKHTKTMEDKEEEDEGQRKNMQVLSGSVFIPQAS